MYAALAYSRCHLIFQLTLYGDTHKKNSPIPVTHALFFQLGVGTSGPQSSVFKPDGVCRTRASQQPARETCDVSQVHAPCAMPCDSEQVPIIIVKSAIPVR